MWCGIFLFAEIQGDAQDNLSWSAHPQASTECYKSDMTEMKCFLQMSWVSRGAVSWELFSWEMFESMGLHLSLAMTMIFHCVSLQRREGEGLDKGRWKNYSWMKFSTGISGIIIQTCTLNQKGWKNEKKLQLKLELISEVCMKGDNYICSNS